MKANLPSLDIISVISKLSPSIWQQPKHCHKFTELAFIVDGAGFFTINETSIPVKTGMIILIPPRIYHYFYCHLDGKLEYNILSFSTENSDFFSDELKGTIGSMTDASQYTEYIKNNFQLISELQHSTSKGRLETASTFCLSLLLLVKMLFSEQSVPITETITDGMPQPLFHQIYLFIMDHCSEHLTLQSISGHFGISPSHLSHSFSSSFGISPIEHLIRSRIQASFPYLIHSDRTIDEIAELLGYSTTTLYIRQFSKRTGYTPTEYRKIRRLHTTRFSRP